MVDVEPSDAPGSALLEQVYDQLRAVARARMADERVGHSFQATELVNEAYLRLYKDLPLLQTDRTRFFRAAAEAMRRILIDHARRKRAAKRGGGGGGGGGAGAGAGGLMRVVTDVTE